MFDGANTTHTLERLEIVRSPRRLLPVQLRLTRSAHRTIFSACCRSHCSHRADCDPAYRISASFGSFAKSLGEKRRGKRRERRVQRLAQRRDRERRHADRAQVARGMRRAVRIEQTVQREPDQRAEKTIVAVHPAGLQDAQLDRGVCLERHLREQGEAKSNTTVLE